MPNALFRCDGGASIGIGHVIRCRALAATLEARGWRCWFAMTRESAELFGDSKPIVVPAGIKGAPIVAAAVTARRIDCVVVDHYRLGAPFEHAARGGASVVVVIDDLANRRHDCDLIVDSGPERRATDYARCGGGNARFLLGPRYALLRPEFAARRSKPDRAPKADDERLLITLGGADARRLSGRILAALPSAAETGLEAVVIIGPANPRRSQLAGQAAALGVKCLVNPPDLVGLMAGATMAVTAAGVSCWELACFGVPMVMIVAAENQRASARAVCRAGAAVLFEDTSDRGLRRLAGVVRALAGDRVRRRRMAMAGRKLIDGRGAARVAEAVTKMIATRRQGERS